ncbi:MAG: radical SAM protein [Roseobacter sp.]|nr:radical SAM protein [Roseobacter sp.]
MPRYTSYPPANRFIPSEGSLYQNEWLDAVPDGAALSLYVHVPYCKALCWFCACRTQAAENGKAIDQYVDVLLAELAQLRRKLPRSVHLSRLHLGGGTPTMIKPPQMARLLDKVFEAIPPAEQLDFSVEVDSTETSKEMIENLVTHGMNRAMIGVQDFDPTVQRAIGRTQSFEQTFQVVQLMRDAGLEHIDMELLYGLPRQTAATIAETAQQVLSVDPDRVAVSEYSHLPNLAKRQILIDTRGLPTAEDAFLNSQVARHMLLTDGYEQVGMDHYVKRGDSLIAARDAGTLRRDFEGYSDNVSYALIGLGASAISRFPQGYVQNASATSVYCKHINTGSLAGNRGYGLTRNDQVVAKLIEMLMCRFEIDIPAIHAAFPASTALIDQLLNGVRQVFKPFLVEEAGCLVIKTECRPLARVVCSTIDHIGRTDDTY